MDLVELARSSLVLEPAQDQHLRLAQLVHGGATWNSQVNRKQVRDGAELLLSLLPVFVDTMMSNPSEDWGAPYYPVVD